MRVGSARRTASSIFERTTLSSRATGVTPSIVLRIARTAIL
jgi:hypothetical protein